MGLVSSFSSEQRASALEAASDSLLQMQEIKFCRDFCALLLSNFGLDLRKLKVDENRHILIIEFDVEEILASEPLFLMFS